jgi:hypothetical protein
MKIIQGILLALVLSMVNHAVAGPEETLIVPGSSIAGITLGPNGAQELKKLGKPYRIDRGMSQTELVWKSSRPEGRFDILFVHTVNNGAMDAQPADGFTIDLVRATIAKYRTATGVGVGSTLDQIRKVSPDVVPVDGTPTVFDDVNRGIAFEFSNAPIGHSICIAVMVHAPGHSNIATQEQVAQVFEHGNKE